MFNSLKIEEQPNMELLEDWGPWSAMNLTNKIKMSYWHLPPTHKQPSLQRCCRPMKLKVTSPFPKTLNIPFCVSFLKLLVLTSQKYVFFFLQSCHFYRLEAPNVSIYFLFILESPKHLIEIYTQWVLSFYWIKEWSNLCKMKINWSYDQEGWLKRETTHQVQKYRSGASGSKD